MFHLWLLKLYVKKKGLNKETSGRVLQVKQQYSYQGGSVDAHKHIPVIEYLANGKRYASSTMATKFFPEVWDWANAGDEVTVMYDENDPLRFQAFPGKEIIQKGKFDFVLLGYILPAFLGFGLIYVMFFLIKIFV